jgi:hypothetical protein
VSIVLQEQDRPVLDVVSRHRGDFRPEFFLDFICRKGATD